MYGGPTYIVGPHVLQNMWAYNAQNMYSRPTCIYSRPICIVGPHVLWEHMYWEPTCTVAHMDSTRACMLGPHVYKAFMYCGTSCTVDPYVQ